MSTISDLETKVQSLFDQLNAAKKSLLEAQLAECPIKLGMRVEYRGKTYTITTVDPTHARKWNDFKPWVRGKLHCKNGRLGINSKNLYDDWKLVDSVDSLVSVQTH